MKILYKYDFKKNDSLKSKLFLQKKPFLKRKKTIRTKTS